MTREAANGRSVESDVSPSVLPSEHGTPSSRRLLEAATLAFAERGYHGVSVRDLTAAVGIKAGSFYAHFPSKEALLAELMIIGHEAHHAHVRDAILGAGADPVAQLCGGVRANVTFQATYSLLTIVCNSELHALAPDNRDRVLALRHDSGVLVAAVVDRGNAAGAFSCPDTWLALSAIAAMGVRVAWWYRAPGLFSDGSPLAEYARRAQAWLPEADYDLDAIADGYADFALKIVGAV